LIRRLPPPTKPDSAVSIRCTPLRYEAANEPLRWLASSLRFVPRIEAGGDRPRQQLMLVDSPASRIEFQQINETATR
jgi:hypothetical protein